MDTEEQIADYLRNYDREDCNDTSCSFVEPLPEDCFICNARGLMELSDIKRGLELLELEREGKLVKKQCEICGGEVQPDDDYCEPCRLEVNTAEDRAADEQTRHQGV